MKHNSDHYYNNIVNLLDNIEMAVDIGARIDGDIRRLIFLIDQYGYARAVESRISAGFPPLEELDLGDTED